MAAVGIDVDRRAKPGGSARLMRLELTECLVYAHLNSDYAGLEETL